MLCGDLYDVPSVKVGIVGAVGAPSCFWPPSHPETGLESDGSTIVGPHRAIAWERASGGEEEAVGGREAEEDASHWRNIIAEPLPLFLEGTFQVTSIHREALLDDLYRPLPTAVLLYDELACTGVAFSTS